MGWKASFGLEQFRLTNFPITPRCGIRRTQLGWDSWLARMLQSLPTQGGYGFEETTGGPILGGVHNATVAVFVGLEAL